MISSKSAWTRAFRQRLPSLRTRRKSRARQRRYPTWDDVLAAEPEALADSIRQGGLANQKAPRIQQVLARVSNDCGDWRLDHLAQMPLDEAKSWLRSLPGVGPKTAACVLMFALGRPALPVDTHVFRVVRRLGLIECFAAYSSTVVQLASARERARTLLHAPLRRHHARLRLPYFLRPRTVLQLQQQRPGRCRLRYGGRLARLQLGMVEPRQQHPRFDDVAFTHIHLRNASAQLKAEIGLRALDSPRCRDTVLVTILVA